MLQARHLLDEKGHEVYSIGADEPVLAAIRTMAERGIGALLVLREGRLAGIVSERDYARNIILRGRSSADTPVRDIMVAELVTVAPTDSVETCMRLCTEHRVRHLPVLENGKVAGVLSIGNLVKAVISEQSAQIEHLQRYIAG